MNTFKEIRERLGLTQQEIAVSLGCTQGNVSLLERGQTVMPDTAKKLIQLAVKRGVALTYEDIYGPVSVSKKQAGPGHRQNGRPRSGGRVPRGRA
jgi:transcriptional regulator with XRE-family HTH domain